MAVRDYQPQQYMMLFSEPKAILGEDHLCFIVDDIVENLDLSKLPEKRDTCGAPCYDYRLLIKILFYGYATGTFNSRKLMHATQENLAYLYLTRQQTPNFRTISDFRKTYREFLECSFVHIVQMAKTLGMVKLGYVTLDSTKIKANASKDKYLNKDRLSKEHKKIKEAIENGIKVDEEEDHIFGPDKTGNELPDEIKGRAKRLKKIKELINKLEKTGKDKIHASDPDASYMKDKDGFNLSYNCQAAVDGKSKLIVAGHVSTNASDQGALKTQIASIEKNLQEKPNKLLADSGYYSVDNLKYLENREIDGYIPHQDDARNKKDKYKTKPQLFDKKHFKYNHPEDQYICPEKKILSKKTVQSGKGLTLYQAKDCTSCKSKNACVRSKKGFRIVSRYKREDLIEKMRFKLSTEYGQKQYLKRAPTAESLFAHFKKNLGFRQFFCRGHSAVSTEFKLLCIGHNIRKIAQFLHAEAENLALEMGLC